MPIKFACPHCKKSISAKEHLAGKKVKCPACKEALTVPAPVSAPADVEDLAMSVLAEKPAAQPAAEAKPIEFTCPQCDEVVTVPAELAGKQTPCPHCGRIVKVPLPKKVEPKDWRKAPAAGPSAARENLEAPAAPEGAWGTATAGRVSQDALVEAGAIPEERERLTPAQWAKRGALVGVPVLVLGFLVWWGYGSWARGKDARAVNQVLTAAKGLRDKRPEAAAELYRGAGEYFLRTNKPGCGTQARDQFREARQLLASDQARGSERDLLLIELALIQADLGGAGPEVDNDTRLNWTKTSTKMGAQKPGAYDEVQETLNHLHAPEARLAAIREVSRKLCTRGKAPLAAGLAALAPSDDLRAEASAVAGLELWRSDPAGPEAETQARQALEALARAPAGDKPPVSSSLIALCAALDKKELLEKLPAEWRKGPQSEQPPVVLGVIEGLALRGDAAKAHGLIPRLGGPQDRVQAHLSIAAALAAKQPEEARKELEEAAQEVAQHGRNVSPWLVLRLIELGGRTGLAEQTLQPLPAAVADPGLRGWAQLEVLRVRLDAAKEKAEDNWADAVDKETTGAHVAREALTRHNARFDGGTLAEAQKAPEPYRPFATLGALLGRQDGK